MEEYINFKIIVLGPQGVGKSSLITRYINGEFSEQYHVTVGVEYSSKILTIDENTLVRLQIWDTAGQQLFKAVVRTFYKGISAVFLIYAVNSAKSFQQLKNWVEEVREYAHQEVVLFLLASKSDLQDEREVSVQDSMTFLKEIGGVFFMETSSKSGYQIQTLFQRASEILHKKFQASASFRNLVRPLKASGFTDRTDSVQLQRQIKQKRKIKNKCC